MTDLDDLISADHLALLVSAAVDAGLVVAPTAAAFATTCDARAAGAVVGTADSCGQLLLNEHLAAQRWAAEHDDRWLSLPTSYLYYRHRPVVRYSAVEVLRAARAYERCSTDSPGWAGSTARRLLTALVQAFIERLPGFSDAPDRWTRPVERSGPAVGACESWAPHTTGLRWASVLEALPCWCSAALVLVTDEALGRLPEDLPARPGLYVCSRTAFRAQDWPILDRLQPDAIVQWPAGRDWLLAQLADPQRAYTSMPLP